MEEGKNWQVRIAEAAQSGFGFTIEDRRLAQSTKCCLVGESHAESYSDDDFLDNLSMVFYEAVTQDRPREAEVLRQALVAYDGELYEEAQKLILPIKETLLSAPFAIETWVEGMYRALEK